MHLEVDQKYYLRQKKGDGLVHPVLDPLDNYKILSERMNVLTIYISSLGEIWDSVDQRNRNQLYYMYLFNISGVYMDGKIIFPKV